MTKVQSVLKTDQRADVSAHAFFSAHLINNWIFGRPFFVVCGQIQLPIGLITFFFLFYAPENLCFVCSERTQFLLYKSLFAENIYICSNSLWHIDKKVTTEVLWRYNWWTNRFWWQNFQNGRTEFIKKLSWTGKLISHACLWYKTSSGNYIKG